MRAIAAVVLLAELPLAAPAVPTDVPRLGALPSAPPPIVIARESSLPASPQPPARASAGPTAVVAGGALTLLLGLGFRFGAFGVSRFDLQYSGALRNR